MKKQFFLAIIILSFINCFAQDFKIDDIVIGYPRIHYLDPEFIDYKGQYTVMFTDSVYGFGSMWVADRNPVSGKFTSKDGLNVELDKDIAPIYEIIINDVVDLISF